MAILCKMSWKNVKDSFVIFMIIYMQFLFDWMSVRGCIITVFGLCSFIHDLLSFNLGKSIEELQTNSEMVVCSNENNSTLNLAPRSTRTYVNIGISGDASKSDMMRKGYKRGHESIEIASDASEPFDMGIRKSFNTARHCRITFLKCQKTSSLESEVQACFAFSNNSEMIDSENDLAVKMMCMMDRTKYAAIVIQESQSYDDSEDDMTASLSVKTDSTLHDVPECFKLDTEEPSLECLTDIDYLLQQVHVTPFLKPENSANFSTKKQFLTKMPQLFVNEEIIYTQAVNKNDQETASSENTEVEIVEHIHQESQQPIKYEEKVSFSIHNSDETIGNASISQPHIEQPINFTLFPIPTDRTQDALMILSDIISIIPDLECPYSADTVARAHISRPLLSPISERSFEGPSLSMECLPETTLFPPPYISASFVAEDSSEDDISDRPYLTEDSYKAITTYSSHEMDSTLQDSSECVELDTKEHIWSDSNIIGDEEVNSTIEDINTHSLCLIYANQTESLNLSGAEPDLLTILMPQELRIQNAGRVSSAYVDNFDESSVSLPPRWKRRLRRFFCCGRT